MSVSALASRIDSALKRGIGGTVRVVGEVSGFRERTHWYFDLKDESAVINVVMFASRAARARVRPENGQELVVAGTIEFYAPGGKVSLIASSIELRGAGELELRFRALCEELRGLGWFAPERKRPLPKFPRRVAVVTSRTGAALQDVIDTMNRRMPAIELVLVDVRVQGPAAVPEIADAIRALGAHHEQLKLDAILLTRGGGSMEDLWAFNERIVAEAIVACPIPVVAAVGHETDTTIAELVADERCATPTQAAMKLSPDRAELKRQLDSIKRRLGSDIERRLSTERRFVQSIASRPCLASGVGLIAPRRDQCRRLNERLRATTERRIARGRASLDQLRHRLEAARPHVTYAAHRERVGYLAARLSDATRARVDRAVLTDLRLRLLRAVRARVDDAQARVLGLETHLRALSPVRVLERGYSITQGPDGRVLRSVCEALPDSIIQTRLADGTIHSRVIGDRNQSGRTRPLRTGRTRSGESQGNLFADPE